MLAEARLIAATDASVLIRGESGTARRCWRGHCIGLVRAANGPFIAVNCAAIPDNLLERVVRSRKALHRCGSAASGLIAQADGGTLFLDEIGDMPLALQVKLLRVLQEREVRPLVPEVGCGGCARDLGNPRDLESLIGDGLFREDLFYRLNVVALQLPH
jgi:two-component system response regulator GlrR